jgi:hypothetical protein
MSVPPAVVGVIELDGRHDDHPRTEVQEMSPVLARFGDKKPVARYERRTIVKREYAGPGDHRGIEPKPPDDRARHCRGRRFSVYACDGRGIRPHGQKTDRLRVGDARDAHTGCRGEIGIRIRGISRGMYHEFRIVCDVRCGETLADRDTDTFENLVGVEFFVRVRPDDEYAVSYEHLRECRHSRTFDTDEMNVFAAIRVGKRG